MELLEFKASISVNVQLRGYLHSGSNCVEKDLLHNANLPVKGKKILKLIPGIKNSNIQQIYTFH